MKNPYDLIRLGSLGLSVKSAATKAQISHDLVEFILENHCFTALKSDDI